MKRLLLARSASLGIVAFVRVAGSMPFDFAYTGRFVDFTVPAVDTYLIISRASPNFSPPAARRQRGRHARSGI